MITVTMIVNPCLPLELHTLYPLGGDHLWETSMQVSKIQQRFLTFLLDRYRKVRR